MAEAEFTDAIALLKADHRKVEDLFEQFEKASGDGEAELRTEICIELKIHAMIEEEIFYPAFRGKIEDDVLDEAYVEHDGAKVLINDIEAGSPDDDFYDAKVTVLSEEIKHHVEGRGDARRRHVRAGRKTDVDLVALRDAMKARQGRTDGAGQRRGPAPGAAQGGQSAGCLISMSARRGGRRAS